MRHASAFEGAHQALSQARSRVEEITEASDATDIEETLLAHLADLKALVSGTVEGPGHREPAQRDTHPVPAGDPAALELGGPC